MKRLISTLLLLLVLIPSFSHAASKNYIYRHRANWVKLAKLSNKQQAGQQLQHPNLSITPNQMSEMLMSIKLTKGKMFSENVSEIEVFTKAEANKYAPLLIKALSIADPNQVVNMAIVHKRPHFILRSDFISIANVYVKEGKLHLYFTKIYAKLDGDYKQASRIDEAIRRAKSVRTSFKIGEGQVISPNGKEIILDLGHMFVRNETAEELQVNIPASKKTKKVSNKKIKKQRKEVYHTNSNETKSAASRLRTLDNLKKEKLISEKEYQLKKKEILAEL
jgi:hypothetical protein